MASIRSEAPAGADRLRERCRCGAQLAMTDAGLRLVADASIISDSSQPVNGFLRCAMSLALSDSQPQRSVDFSQGITMPGPVFAG